MTGLRPLQATELASLARLHGICFADAWSETMLAELLASPGVFGILAEAGEGFVLVRAIAGEAEILSIGVIPDHRRKGIGRALLSAAAVEARRRGAERLFLEVASDNGPALALYRRAGFVKVGRRTGYYHRRTGTVAAEILAIDLSEDESRESLGGGIRDPEVQ